MDEFKRHLQQFKESLDVDMPSEDLWKKIKHKQQKKLSIKWYAVAAVFIGCFLGGLLKYNHLADEINIPKVAEVKTPIDEPNKIDLKKEETYSKLSDRIEKKTFFPAHKNQDSYISKFELDEAEIKDFKLEIENMAAKLAHQPVYIDDPQYFDLLTDKWKALKRDENEISAASTLVGDQFDVADHLIRVYQKKIWLLRQLQNEINKINRLASIDDSSENLSTIYIKL